MKKAVELSSTAFFIYISEYPTGSQKLAKQGLKYSFTGILPSK